MGSKLDAFWGNAPRPMRLGAIGFGIAMLGAVFGFSISYGPENPWSYFAFGMVVLGVAIGFISIIWGWASFFSGKS